MVSKTNISIGVLLIVLLATGVVYISLGEKARIRVDNDKSTFYVKNDNNRWTVSGREYNKLFDGTTQINRDVQSINVTTDIENDLVTITRTTPYKRGPVIVDTYKFDGKIDDIELFPISHTIEIFNGTGYFYKYEVKDLTYDGDTFKLDGTQTAMKFGKNMKVTWWENYRLGWVYKTGSMYVKSDKIDSDYVSYKVRLFDPVGESYVFSLFFDGVNSTRKYEYRTVANITTNISNCSGDCRVCVDIDDSITNLSFDLGSKNFTCGNNSVSFLYNITTLRVNEFNDSTVTKELSTNGSVYIDLDNRTNIVSLSFNITGKSTTCYQETANVSTACGGLSNGNYSGNLSYVPLWYDGDFSTFNTTNINDDTSIYINYTKPSGTISSSLWQVKDINDGTSNITIIAGCFNQDVLQLRVRETIGGK